ncbi:LAMI_0H16842g1_1 [Lachancea mirantina]|uniref:Anaphase-promoting complex subunit 2 n=1 Tax=Lachancea mirantina TaxID=1230905 RepID=A0A1G4KJ69_9SACH|nr:LAMI_0H16842g1_1 [Lachancea mirantina]
MFIDEVQQLDYDLHNSIKECGSALNDDLEGVLTWLNPNEAESNHQLRPPSLRIKSGIRHLSKQFETKSTLPDLLKTFMVLNIRVHFFRHYEELCNFKQVQKLERYYRYPFRFIKIISDHELNMEFKQMRCYLVSKRPVLCENIEEQMRLHFMEDDFDIAEEMRDWLSQAMDNSCMDLFLDMLLERIRVFSEQQMRGYWNQNSCTAKTYELFVKNQWPNIARFLNCPENDNELLSQILECFQSEYVRVCASDIYELFVLQYPASKPALVELRSIIKTPYGHKELIEGFLQQFKMKALNSSITTAEILLSYVRAIKSVFTVDVSGTYLPAITELVKPCLMERHDAVRTFLYALLELNSEEIQDSSFTASTMSVLAELSSELKDKRFASFDAPATEARPSIANDLGGNLLRPFHEKILDRFLNWTPKPLESVKTDSDALLMNKSLLDFAFEVFDSREMVFAEFIGIFTNKLLGLKDYKLDSKWVKTLKVLRKKAEFKSVSGVQEVSNINNIDVMLRDMRDSSQLCEQLHQLEGLDNRFFPKIISYLFWKVEIDLVSPKNEDFEMPVWLKTELKRYTEAFSRLKVGRKFVIHKHLSTVSLRLSFEDGRVIKSEVDFVKASVISCFLSSKSDSGLTTHQIADRTRLTLAVIEQTLEFWEKVGAIYLEPGNECYRILENFDSLNARQNKSKEKLSTGERDARETGARADDEHQAFMLSMSKVWPFIQGMLMNLGSLKASKIHSFLKMAVPSEIGFSATPAQLESYLRALVDEEKLSVADNGSYKLVR